MRWYLRYSLSLRDVEELLIERGLEADRTTIWRWIQRYGPELEERLCRHLKATNKSWGVDETYLRAKGRWCCLYQESCTEVVIAQRLCRGDIDSAKTDLSQRTVALPPMTTVLLKDWMGLIRIDPEAWVFASENPTTPLWRDNLWYRHMKPGLDKVRLGWTNFRVMRRTHASLGHDGGIDPKVAADQRGHGIGVALNVYTKANIGRRAETGAKLERPVFAS